MLTIIAIILGIGITIFSYSFVDFNLVLTKNILLQSVFSFLHGFIINNRVLAALLYGLMIGSLFVFYVYMLRKIQFKNMSWKQLRASLVVLVLILLVSYPAFSYDIFNYMATAKVAFGWKENPWVTMPVDIPNEPALAYTRAANKTALYGPTWIGLTSLPYFLGQQKVWLSILLFKSLVAVCYAMFVWLIYKQTKSLWQTVFFAANPLVIIEIFVSGHNDIVMVLLAIAGLLLTRQPKVMNRMIGAALWLASVMVKGATVVLLPLLFLSKVSFEHVMLAGYWLLFTVFLLTPLREEMYPWYAVWWLGFLVFLPIKKYRLLYSFSGFFSFGLILRHLPYIGMGYYEGIGPILRIAFMVLPILIWMGVERKAIVLLIRQAVRLVLQGVRGRGTRLTHSV